MMGSDLLVAPVVEEGKRTRDVVLPQGVWTADDGKTYAGPARITIEAGINRLPYFKKSGKENME